MILAELEKSRTQLRILLVGLDLALPNIEHRGGVRNKRGPNKGKLTHPHPKIVAQAIRELMARVQDETRCNDDCKWMYFCERKKGHRGRHVEGGLSWE